MDGVLQGREGEIFLALSLAACFSVSFWLSSYSQFDSGLFLSSTSNNAHTRGHTRPEQSKVVTAESLYAPRIVRVLTECLFANRTA